MMIDEQNDRTWNWKQTEIADNDKRTLRRLAAGFSHFTHFYLTACAEFKHNFNRFSIDSLCCFLRM